jgi:AraC family transcriptional regulator
MTTRLTHLIPLFDRRAARRIVPIRDERSVAIAQALHWPGVLLEAGRNDIVEADDIALAHHYLGVNADEEPVSMEVREPTGWRHVTLMPGEGWLVPAGESFSLRVRCARPHAYVRVSIDPLYFERLVSSREHSAKPIALRRAYGIGGAQVRHLLAALAAEAGAGTPTGLAFVDTLTTALALQIVQQAGVPQHHAEPARGGLAPVVRRRVLELMDAQSDRQLTLDVLAREAGLSLTHFARAFKESVGRAPHQHLMLLRLERARRLLEAPDVALSDVAVRAGFADQAHFTRLFKRQFGVTPGAFVRSHRPGAAHGVTKPASLPLRVTSPSRGIALWSTPIAPPTRAVVQSSRVPLRNVQRGSNSPANVRSGTTRS